jgi:DNA-binding transcriptional ArsR family regulator
MLSKTEILWRHLLVEALEHDNRRTSVTELSERFALAPSTVHRALVVPREMGALDTVRSGLVLRDPMRLLLHWAGTRRLAHDRPFRIHTGLPVSEIQDRLPASAVPTGAAAYARRFRNDVADYSVVYCYHDDPSAVVALFPDEFGEPDLVILEPDPFLSDYGDIASVPQTYVDLFVTAGWQAQRFLHAMSERLEVASAI